MCVSIMDNVVIAKLKSQCSADCGGCAGAGDSILWSEVGTKQDYEAEYGPEAAGRVRAGDRRA